MKKSAVLMLVSALLLGLLSGCGQEKKAAAAEQTTLTIAGPWEESPAFEAVSAAFTEANPGCRVVYEYVQNYYEAMKTRLAGDDSGVDLFVTKNLQADSELLPYAEELFSHGDELDLSGTFDGLIQNFTYMGTAPGAAAQIYAIPLGTEIRGLYVNKTLLGTLGLSVPENRAELLAACRRLKDAGYIPFQGNPGNFSQWLLYPCVCNLIANAPDYAAVYERVNSREAGVSELFRDPMEFLYTLVQNGYYDYKTSETTYGCFTDSGTAASARGFLNITGADGSYAKADDVGFAAFMPGTMSMDTAISRLKDDYHSAIDYTFVLAPTGEDGGYAYVSPSDGVALNKNSRNAEWALRYLNFLFTPEHNKLFAEKHHITPNTSDVVGQIAEKFGLPESRISQLGSVTFDYAFYTVITDSLREVSKANNPKYMAEDGTMHPFSYYMEALETRFRES